VPDVSTRNPKIRGAFVACLLLAVFTGCFAPSAARRSGRLIASGWDSDRWGPWVALTGPGMLLYSIPDFAMHALVPIDYDGYFLGGAEPTQKWFRFYDGPMQALDQVAILCSRESSTTVTTIRTEAHERATYARHQKWHYPQCIEVLPGTYELTVDFYSRESFRRDMTLATYSTESTTPATVTWKPSAGEIYALSAVLGGVTPSPGEKYQGTTIKKLTRSKTNLGANEFTLDEGHWVAIVERVASLDSIEAPVLGEREAWKRYELRRRSR
jgi:hypothetical protein